MFYVCHHETFNLIFCHKFSHMELSLLLNCGHLHADMDFVQDDQTLLTHVSWSTLDNTWLVQSCVSCSSKAQRDQKGGSSAELNTSFAFNHTYPTDHQLFALS